jgi:hypothetical protein
MSDMHGNTSRFEHAVTAVILANSVVMLWGLLDHSREELLENVDLAVAGVLGRVDPRL